MIAINIINNLIQIVMRAAKKLSGQQLLHSSEKYALAQMNKALSMNVKRISCIS